jgi:hypothetical protein
MKKLIAFIFIFGLSSSLQAKKVKFAVDMGTYTISPNGIHIIGDFQVLAGFGTLDWDPATTQLNQEGNSTIYSIVVNLPAFNKYEFKFVNGDQTYETEFVPDESRVGGFNDNRWLYVDSLANDTTYAGAVIFGANAPAGKTLVRYKVDMSNAGNLSNNGIHIGTSYQSSAFDPTKIRLYSFGNNVYEIINYTTNNTYGFIYYNGNNAINTETVPSSCSLLGKRSINVVKDTVLPVICFSSCTVCVGVGFKENTKSETVLKLYPNPATDALTIQSNISGKYSVTILNVLGKQVLHYSDLDTEKTTVTIQDLSSGIYVVQISGNKNQITTQKLVVN